MPYDVVWKPSGEEDLDGIADQDAVLASKILDQIDRLAEDPTGLSRPPSFPHPRLPKYQFWIADVDEANNAYVTVLFSFAPDETRIAIHFVVVQRVPKDYPFTP